MTTTITTIKNVFQNKADLLSVLRRKGTTPAKEILENPTELEILVPETGAELFASYKGLLEEEAITAYEKKITQYTLEKGRDLKSIIQKAAGKLERKLTKSELEKILGWQDEEVAEETICDWLCGESNSNFQGQLYKGKRNPDVDFVNGKGKSTLNKHACKHGYMSPEEYLKDARNFLEKEPTLTTQSFVSDKGTYFRYTFFRHGSFTV